MKAAVSKNVFPFVFIIILAFALRANAGQQLYSHGDPSPQEQYLLELMDRARAYPAAEGYEIGSLTSDPAAKKQLIQVFKTYAAKPPLAFNAALLNTARRHSQYMIDNNIQSAYETNTSDPFYTGSDDGARIYGAVPDLSAAGENLDAGALTLDGAHTSFLVDAGVPDLGHRTNMMSLNLQGVEQKFNQIGIGVVNVSHPTTQVGPIVVTEDFGLDTQVFLTGVVYNDLNQDGFYQPGEGLAGVTITPNSGDYYAVTSSSGGFAIPILPGANTSISVTASGGALGAGVTKTITTTGSNIKLDFTQQPLPPTPLTVAVVAPSSSMSAGSKAVISVSRTLNLDSVLLVQYSLKGDAINGVDYARLSGTLLFPAGFATQTVKIKSLLSESGIQKTVTLKIKKSALNLKPAEASVAITN